MKKYIVIWLLFPLILFASAELKKHKEDIVPKSLMQAHYKARQDIKPIYNTKDGYEYKAYNINSDFNIQFGKNGLKLVSDNWEFGMKLDSYGQEKNLKHVEKSELFVNSETITYKRKNIDEWYINDKKGLEQGFTLNRPAGYIPGKDIILSFIISGDVTPKWKKEGYEISFYKDDSLVFNYHTLKAFDSNGKSLPSKMVFKDNRVDLVVNTNNVKWPIVVDPIFTQDKFHASDALAFSYFGGAVEIKGNTAFVGADSTDENGTDSGSVYIYTRSGNTWSEVGKLYASDAEDGDKYGFAISLDDNGTTLAVGARHADKDATDTRTGAVYIYTGSGATWTEEVILTIADGVINDKFGLSVSLDGDTLAASAHLEDDDGTDSGSAYIFVRDANGTWSQQQKLTASNAAAGDQFGIEVALDGDTVAISAKLQDRDVVGDATLESQVGAVYIFVRSGTTWTQQAELHAPDPAAWHYFGTRVSLDGDSVLISATQDDTGGTNSGAAYVFTRSGTTWSYQAKLIHPAPVFGEQLGQAAFLKGDTAVLATRYNNTNPPNPLTEEVYDNVYIFNRTGSTWASQDAITDVNKTAGDRFGFVTRFYGDTLVVGAIRDALFAPLDRAGSVYFHRFDCGYGDTLEADKWRMITLPCDLGVNDTVENLFEGNFDAIDYSLKWVIYKLDTTTDEYVKLSLSDNLEEGKSYWIKSKTVGTWDANGTKTTYPITTDCSNPNGCYEISLTPPDETNTSRYNMVGYPGNLSVDWSDVRFVVDGTAYSPSDANASGYAAKEIWKYNGSSYDTYDDVTPGAIGVLDSHEGFLVKLLGPSSGSTVSLLIPTAD